jgi:myo-inositol-1(or 4)-monophosphatase
MIPLYSPTPDPLQARLAALAQIVRQAAAAARAAFETRPRGSYVLKGPQDYLTEADAAVEVLIRADIAALFPQDAVLGEEHGGTPTAATWVINPIDGPANFARGVAHFCVSIAYAVKGRTELGAVAQPMRGEVWLARRGGGATLNGVSLGVRTAATPDEAMPDLGWSPRLALPGYLATLGALIGQGASVRRVGSGALALAHLADGRSDGYLEPVMHRWGCMAGLLRVAEAGGRVGSWPATLADLSVPGAVLAAANPAIEALLTAALGAARKDPLNDH